LFLKSFVFVVFVVLIFYQVFNKDFNYSLLQVENSEKLDWHDSFDINKAIVEINSLEENEKIKSESISRKDRKILIDGEYFINDNDLNCMTTAIYFESKSEDFSGKLAVADVIKLRMERTGLSACDVIFKHETKYRKHEFIKSKCAFSWYCNGKTEVLNDDEIFLFEDARKAAIYSLGAPIKLKADFFHSIDQPYPYWAYHKDFKFVKQVGKHRFYLSKNQY
jgi:spore germination cell wall hydrolase CwlJ-like protein